MDIADLVRQKARSFTLALPEPKPGRKWVRLDCPFCKGKKANSAAINYDAGWFECYRCKTKISARRGLDSAVIERFHFQILYQVQQVMKEYGRWIDREHATAKAQWFVHNYANGKRGGRYSAGMLDDWYGDTMGEPDKIERYVSKALRGDLRDWARREVRWKKDARKGEHYPAVDDAMEIPGMTVCLASVPSYNTDGEMQGSDLEYVASLDRSRPTDQGTEYGGGWDVAPGNNFIAYGLWALALDDRITFDSWGLGMQCTKLRNGIGPYAGHCQDCDSRIAEAAYGTPAKMWERTYRSREVIVPDLTAEDGTSGEIKRYRTKRCWCGSPMSHVRAGFPHAGKRLRYNDGAELVLAA